MSVLRQCGALLVSQLVTQHLRLGAHASALTVQLKLLKFRLQVEPSGARNNEMMDMNNRRLHDWEKIKRAIIPKVDAYAGPIELEKQLPKNAKTKLSVVSGAQIKFKRQKK